MGDAIANVDGLLLVTPEYNSSLPGPFKNAIDWLSPIEGGAKLVFTCKPVAVIGASPGGFGTLLSQYAWLPGLRTLATRKVSTARWLIGWKRSATSNIWDEAFRLRVCLLDEGYSPGCKRVPGAGGGVSGVDCGFIKLVADGRPAVWGVVRVHFAE